ncbi:hypothetical protein KAW80_00630 [Candidatus Babeliales bacterium]|nr:hypothetical protein [Candidatus Babeliales bacterium]
MSDTEQTPTSTQDFTLKIEKNSSHLARGIVEIDKDTIEAIKNQIIDRYRNQVIQTGFKETPLEYIKNHYQKEIRSSIKSFLLRYYVVDYLTNELINQGIIVANFPRLYKIEFTSENALRYIFDISTTNPIPIREWKHFSFKAPKRKNYKDLDKQVSYFIKKEQERSKSSEKDRIEENDWVCFDAILVDPSGRPVPEIHKNNLWVRMNINNIPNPFLESFLNKKIGDTFLSNQLSLYDNFEDESGGKQSFFITISALIKGTFCNMDAFKAMFRLKNKSDIHEKLIEVFSYRNDISQRKSIIEEMFNLFFAKHRFEIPKHLIIRKQEEILFSLKQRPDYQVYKLNNNFSSQIEVLAEKQLKEEILMDQLANHENIRIDVKDIQNYLNLFSNHRLKEFVYFKPSQDILEDNTLPIHHSLLRHLCRREKTLNYVLYHLTR